MKVVVIGAGLNGLAAAAALVDKGHEVVVLERRPVPGGLAAGEEFHPGFRHQGIFHDSELAGEAASRLGLAVALREPPPLHHPSGEALAWPDSYRAFIQKLAPFVRTISSQAPVDIRDEAPLMPLARTALKLRQAGRDEMMELLRVAPLSLVDFTEEHWSSPLQRALVAWTGLLGGWLGPVSPSSAANLLLHDTRAGQEVVGGPAALVEALCAKVTVRCDAAVARIRVEGGRAVGVELADGERVDADAVLSCIGPRRTLMELVPPGRLPELVERDIERVRLRGIVAKVHLACSEPLLAHERVRVVDHILDWERAFDAAKHRRVPEAPPLDIRQQGSTLSILVHGCHYDVDGEALGAQVLARLGGVADTGKVLGMEVLTPRDLEQRYGCEGGHLFHGELALDQFFAFRPTVQLAPTYQALPGLFLGSAGMHPGGPPSLWPGLNAAAALAP